MKVLVDTNVFLGVATISGMKIGDHFDIDRDLARKITCSFFNCMNRVGFQPILLPEIYKEVCGKYLFRDKIEINVLPEINILFPNLGNVLSSDIEFDSRLIDESVAATSLKVYSLFDAVQLFCGIDLKRGSLHFSKKQFCEKFPEIMVGKRNSCIDYDLLKKYADIKFSNNLEKIMFMYIALTVMLSPKDESKKFPLNNEDRLRNYLVDATLILCGIEFRIPIFTGDFCLKFRADFIFEHFGLPSFTYLMEPKKEAEDAILEDLERRIIDLK